MSLLQTIKSLLGISKNESKISELDNEISDLKKFHPKSIAKTNFYEKNVLKILNNPMTTLQVAKKLKKSRTWTSLLLNKLERDGKVKEVGKKGRSILYRKK